jgi:glycosyltransferase involved in cell wall biosynthesis
MNIALCICTRNRPQDLRNALTAAQESVLLPAQIIVSDDSDEAQAPETQAVCASFPGVTYLSGPHRGLSANRNHCLAHLTDEIEAVSYIDDDVTIRPDFLLRAAERLKDAPAKTIITGRECKNGLDVTPHNCSFWGHQDVPPRGPDDYHTIVINTTLFPRFLFAEASFDEALRYGSEEADMCAQAEAIGYRISFCPELVNDHHPSTVNREEYKQFVEASRLYSTYKRYRWLERKPLKSAIFGILAQMHMTAGILKSGRLKNFKDAWEAIGTAARYARSEQLRRTSMLSSPKREELPCQQ